MPITFELIDVVILIGICQGVFLSLTLQRITNNNRAANTILSLLIVICTVMLMGRFLMIRFFSKAIFLWALIADVVIFVFGPLFYSYVRRLLLKKAFSSKISYVHYLPAILFSIVAIAYLVYYTPISYYDAYRNGELTLMFNLVLVAGIISNMIYLFLSYKVLTDFKKQIQHQISFTQSPVKYLQFFLMAIGAIILVWALTFLNIKFLNRYLLVFNYDVVWAIIPLFIYVIGYFSLKQPELFRAHKNPKPKEVKNRLDPEETRLLKTKLDSLMINDKIFLQSDLTLTDVSEKINASTNNVSWLLNNHYEMTFYDYVNSYRVKEFVRKVENQEYLQRTILGLSMDVGFNSKSTFNKAFKLTMKQTPSNFIKKHRAA